jgi:hypothetical protein
MMGIVLSVEQQTYFNTYKNMNKTTNTAELDIAYANFLKVLKDVDPTTHKGLIYLNKYLDPAYFESSNYDAAQLNSLYTTLDSYINTTEQDVRNTRHQELLLYLKNNIVSDLFLETPLRTKSVFTVSEYTDGGDISTAYVADAAGSESIGSVAFENTMMV